MYSEDIKASVPRPLRHLQHFAGKIDLDSLGRKIERLRAKRREPGEWPKWCYLPTHQLVRLLRKRPELLEQGQRIAMVATWRVTQGIYRYDASILEELWNSPITGDLPIDLLHRLPEWCVYIDIERVAPMIQIPPGGNERLHGVFVRLDVGPPEGSKVLSVILDYAIGLVPMYIPLRGTLEESIRLTGRQIAWSLARIGGPMDINPLQAKQLLAHILSLVLYLCSTEPDITDSDGAGRVSKNSAPQDNQNTKRHSTSRIDIPSSPSQWYVGYRLGAAFRQAKERVQSETPQPSGTRAPPIGHVRRAHWHTFWVGPKNEPEKRKRQLKWLPPIPINLDDVAELVATVRPVTK